MKILSIKGEFFKGCREAEYEFFDRTIIKGKNGSGKTTVADMWYWLVSDKQSDMMSSPEVHSDFAAESEPSVTVKCDVDGNPRIS